MTDQREVRVRVPPLLINDPWNASWSLNLWGNSDGGLDARDGDGGVPPRSPPSRQRLMMMMPVV